MKRLCFLLSCIVFFSSLIIPITVMAEETGTPAETTATVQPTETKQPVGTDQSMATDQPSVQYSKSDYAYVYLVTSKKYNLREDYKGKSYKRYDKFAYKYNDFGLVVESNRKTDQKMFNRDKLGKTSYEYDKEGNLILVNGPYFEFSYSYNKGRIKKYNMYSAAVVMGYDGPTEYKHTLKYRKRDRSIYNPACPYVPLLSSGDRYFFDKKGIPSKAYWFKGFLGNSWSGKCYYKYDKKGNLIQQTDKNTGDYVKARIYKHKLKYKKRRFR